MVALSRYAGRLGAACLLAASMAQAAPGKALSARSTDKLVFCHFMIGIVSDRNSAADYDDDMRRAKAAGIDAFALNIGTDTFGDEQLNYAYESAARNGMKVFISFDYNWWHSGDTGVVANKLSGYADKPAQLWVDDKVFVSSFTGDQDPAKILDIDGVRSAATKEIFFAPNFHPWEGSSDKIDAALNWMAWPSNGYNKAPDERGTVTVEENDANYLSWLNGKPYVAPVSPWFFTHFGPEVSYSKNWVFPSGPLIYNRWEEILEQGYPMLEIITWNDYGESHYIGPLSSPHYDDGNSKWVNDMPHDGWLELSKPYIAAYKAGARSVDDFIKEDKIVYWYRRTLSSLNCDATDTTAGRPANNDSGNYFQGRPDGWQTMDDVVYVATLLTEDAELIVNSGGNAKTISVPKGAKLSTVPAGLGPQAFTLKRGTTKVLDGVSLMEIEDVCPCGLYNFNAFVGTLPAGPSDPLGPDGLSSLTVGLHVATCQAKPSLGTAPPAGPTTTRSVPNGNGSGPTSTKNPGSGPTPTGACIRGTVAEGESGNYTGLCEFACHYDYCPPGPCVCKERGDAVPEPPITGTPGCPLAGEPDGYIGLCSYTCNHGYCPPGACTTNC